MYIYDETPVLSQENLRDSCFPAIRQAGLQNMFYLSLSGVGGGGKKEKKPNLSDGAYSQEFPEMMFKRFPYFPSCEGAKNILSTSPTLSTHRNENSEKTTT